MIAPFARQPRPFPVADRTRDGDLYRTMHPRLAAIDLLRSKIADRAAGLDPYDRRIFILEARRDETVWANRALSLVGSVLPTSTDHPGGGIRFRAAIDDDVRTELGLDGANPPLMEDEPLASRGVASDSAILDVLHPSQPRLTLAPLEPLDEPIPIMRASMDRAMQLAALRVDCGCGARAGVECRCTVGDRLASAASNESEVK